MTSDSEAGKKKVLQAAIKAPFLRAIDKDGNIAYKKSEELYLRTNELLLYFYGCQNVWFLDETEGEKIWIELGVAKKPRFKKLTITLSREEKSSLRGNNGHTRDELLSIVVY